MKLLAFCLLLGMSAQGQTPKIDTNVFVNTFIGCAEGITISIATRTGKNDVIAKCHDGYYERVAADFAQAAQRAADETDGKPQIWSCCKLLWIDPKVDPHKPWDEVDGMDWPRKSVPFNDGCHGISNCFYIGPNRSGTPTKAPTEPMDVPAVQEKAGYFICDSPPLYGNSSESPHSCRIQRYKWKCKDTSRVLLTSEDGKKHCIKF